MRHDIYQNFYATDMGSKIYAKNVEITTICEKTEKMFKSKHNILRDGASIPGTIVPR